MTFLLEDGFEKTFNLVKYYLQQAEWRSSKLYVEIAANYCSDVLKVINVPLAVKEKALYLRGLCYLRLAKGEISEIKEQYFLEAALLFVELHLSTLNDTVGIEFNIDMSLFDEFFEWQQQCTGDKTEVSNNYTTPLT